jgi:hypothetical protein
VWMGMGAQARIADTRAQVPVFSRRETEKLQARQRLRFALRPFAVSHR